MSEVTHCIKSICILYLGECRVHMECAHVKLEVLAPLLAQSAALQMYNLDPPSRARCHGTNIVRSDPSLAIVLT